VNLRRLAAAGIWLGAAALVVLAARSLAYALAPPTLLVAPLQHSAGGPHLVRIALVALALAAALAMSVLWLVSLGVRERAALALAEAPRLRPLRIAAHALALTVVTSLGFAALESYLHLRAGLGWHGLHCLLGPVHRDVLPFLAGLSMVAAAVIEAGSHVLAWMQRTVRLLLERHTRGAVPTPALLLSPARLVAPLLVVATRSRGPPLAA
jgi:hypothetical protein